MTKKKRVTVQLRPAKKKARAKTQAVTKKEVGLLGQAIRSLGGLAGGTIGGVFGNPGGGAAVGTGLGASLSKWLGAGDYNVANNSIVGSLRASGTVPSMHLNDQTIVVRHKEFLCEVLSNTSFNVNRTFTINPGNSATFPWLSRLANSYQQYRIRGMVYHYVPTSGSLSSGTSNALGSVMLQTSYRSSDIPPTTKVELLNEYWSSENVPSEAFCHPIECNPSENPFNVQYIRGAATAIPVGDSPLLYDLGSTHLAVSGQASTGVALGDLWVTYEIELKKPIISSNVTSSQFYYGNGAWTGSFANPFGNGELPFGNSGIRTSTARIITLPAALFGEFWFVVTYEATANFTDPTSGGTGVAIAPVGSSSAVGWSPTQPLLSLNTQWTGTGPRMYYFFRVSKFQREIDSVITIPLASATAGTLARVELSVWGTPADI